MDYINPLADIRKFSFSNNFLTNMKYNLKCNLLEVKRWIDQSWKRKNAKNDFTEQ